MNGSDSKYKNKQVVNGIKEKLGGAAVGGILDKVKGLFGK